MANVLLWQPDHSRIEQANVSLLIQSLHNDYPEVSDYASLHAFSLKHQAAFWRHLVEFCQLRGDFPDPVIEQPESAEHAQFFPNARLNFAENMLQYGEHHPDEVAILYKVEENSIGSLSWCDLRAQVSQLQQVLQARGVGSGDVVAGYLPNFPQTVIAMLATTSLGAVWSSTSPDFGSEGAIDRFGQTRPKVLFSVDGYTYNGKVHTCRDKAQAVVSAVDSIECWIEISNIGAEAARLTCAESWDEVLAAYSAKPLTFVPCEFNDPLYILYSSGTTGKPKCIIHSVGGMLLNNLKEHRLHCDVHPGDRVFYFTTCGWMMWNWLVGSLASGATICLYEGSPFYPNGEVLWDYAETAKFSLFGTAAKYLATLEEQQITPVTSHDLRALRTLCSTGSVLAPEQFDYVYQSIKSDIHLTSIAGGTDICGCFAIGNPLTPVYRGETQGSGLALDVQVFDEQGQSVREQRGELVCCNAFPNRPLGFYGDEDGSRYHQAYWARFPGVWHHGDFVARSAHDGLVFYGRSDAVLNPGGVRIGTAEIYNQVNAMEAISDSVVIGQDWDNDCRVILFVVLKEGYTLDDTLVSAIKKHIREQCTPRHVPAKILAVADIPRTKSGKIVELAVRDVVHGREVQQLSALANPQALSYFAEREELAD
ncbi:acetoacetate--CoA ligase [Suttonella sp. R2A3]|uniref:acetoacetate--CoA ligase n=1 Tax=Suttonella sp. R2A3 TaxID=2908648 RepID=UPI001F3F5834|nr:acetoacetate--CoA ligase [Suttonella sp. R2A3]UJF24219.1 acetoacetate--CoA ligase [Suttonella sp. R2A3]